MTRDEILAMEAGPELNALVAITILGWHRQEEAPDPYRCPRGGRDWISPDDKDWRCNHCGQEDGFPDVSGSIAPAWGMVKTVCKAHGLYFRLHRTPDYVWVAFDRWSDTRLFVEAQADDAPEAICKAVLLAVMERDE